ncbi:hypothetical protein BC829DRAFT_277421 [Chytridium lagenaria]|nr:hypothetical protein BC829DRAFT_277421 [Chytridium lagenaria]
MIVDPTTDPGISPPDPLTLLALITALPSASGAYPTPTWVSDTTLGPIPSDHEFGPALPVSRAPLRTRSSPSLNVPDWSPSPPPVFIPRPLSLYSFIVQFRDSVMAVASRIVHMPDNGAVGSARVVAADMSLTPKSGALTPRHGGISILRLPLCERFIRVGLVGIDGDCGFSDPCFS